MHLYKYLLCVFSSVRLGFVVVWWRCYDTKPTGRTTKEKRNHMKRAYTLNTQTHCVFILKYKKKKQIKRQHFASISQQYCKGQRQLRDMLLDG